MRVLSASARLATASESCVASAGAVARARPPARPSAGPARRPRPRLGGGAGDGVRDVGLPVPVLPHVRHDHLSGARLGLRRDGQGALGVHQLPAHQRPPRTPPPPRETALCAAQQNAFWPVHDLLYSHQDVWAPLKEPGAFFLTLADSAKISRPKLLAVRAGAGHAGGASARTRRAPSARAPAARRRSTSRGDCWSARSRCRSSGRCWTRSCARRRRRRSRRARAALAARRPSAGRAPGTRRTARGSRR